MNEQLSFFGTDSGQVVIAFDVPKKVKKEYDDTISELERDFERHQYIMSFGCSDPFWPDGVNIDLKRNHILYGKGKLKEFFDVYRLPLPEIFNRPTPPKLPNDYMVLGSRANWLNRTDKLEECKSCRRTNCLGCDTRTKINNMIEEGLLSM